METIKDLGEIKISSHKEVNWRIPNFYDLPQNYDTVIRSPRFNIDDRDWYMEVYPNGCKLYRSLGWFGIRALNLNFNPCVRGFCDLVMNDPQQGSFFFTKEESHSDGSYCCTRFLPASLLKSWKDIFAPEGDLRLLFLLHDGDDIFLVDNISFNLKADDVQKMFESNFETVNAEACVQAEEKNELPMETTVGKVDINSRRVKWIIPSFSDFNRYTIIRSPRFHYKDSDWHMEVYPNGQSLYSSLGWFGIGVRNLNPDSAFRRTTVSLLEETYKIVVDMKENSQNKGFYCCSKLLPTSLFKSWQDIIAPGGNLRLYFPLNDENDDAETTITMGISKETMQRWYKQKFENAETFKETSTQTDEEIVKENQKQTDGGASTGKSTKTEKGLEKMRQDFLEILLKENITDIVLKVKSHEYKAHRCILAARSPVFLAMMTHDTKEKNTGVVDIPDGDPNVYLDFLNYLYTGSVSNLSSENAANLYTMADKYQVCELKESCKDLMMTSISIDNFCNVFTLSLQHDERELKDACIQFFSKNSLDIIVTCKWQTFLSENPITGNELFIKHLQLNK